VNNFRSAQISLIQIQKQHEVGNATTYLPCGRCGPSLSIDTTWTQFSEITSRENGRTIVADWSRVALLTKSGPRLSVRVVEALSQSNPISTRRFENCAVKRPTDVLIIGKEERTAHKKRIFVATSTADVKCKHHRTCALLNLACCGHCANKRQSPVVDDGNGFLFDDFIYSVPISPS
jgi:hypothetical protein